MFSFFLKQKTALGLDISETALRLMQLKPSGSGFYPSAFVDAALPKGLVVEDRIGDTKKLAEIISRALHNPAMGVFDSRYAVLSLPESKSFVRVISVPKMTEKEADEAVPFEAEQYIPVDADQVYLDFHLVPGSLRTEGNKMKVVICATPKNLVENYVEAIKLAKLKPVAAELESEAVCRALINPESQNTPALIIDSSASRTNLIIFDQGTLQFTSSLPIGGNSFSAQLSQSLTVSFEEAEKLKRQLGLQTGREANKVASALQPLLKSLVEAVKNTMNFYREHSDGNREIASILLSGGACKIKGLAEYLSRQLQGVPGARGKLAVSSGDPWVNVIERPMKKVPPISKLDSMSFTTVIGLALRGVKME